MTLNMRHSSYLILWVAVLAFGRGISAPVASADRGFVQAERATPEMIPAYFSEKTGLYYNCPEERKWTIPASALLQMNVSLRVLAKNDPTRAERANAIRRDVTRLAIDRFLDERGVDGPWLSSGGDLALVVEMNRPLGGVSDETKMKAYEALYAACRRDMRNKKMRFRIARVLSFSTADSFRTVEQI